MLCSFFLRLYSFLIMIVVVATTSPENPIHCTAGNMVCEITNSYGMFPDRSTCSATMALYPTTEEELIHMVRHNRLAGSKMKVATRFSHSIPKLVCPFGDQGVLISTEKLNSVLEVNPESLTITVESGVTLKKLIEVAAENEMALPYTPYWWGLTIGGILGTGAHGSTLQGRGSAVHDHVEQLTIISPGEHADNYVKVRILDQSNEEFHAVKTSLGVLGVIYKITLKLEPLFKRSVTFSMKSDSDLAVRASEFGSLYEFADIVWYPSQGKVVYRNDERVSDSTHGNGRNDYIPFRATDATTQKKHRLKEEDQELNYKIKEKCFDAEEKAKFLYGKAFGFTNDGSRFSSYPVIGYHNQLQASGTCLDDPRKSSACEWDQRLGGRLFYQTGFSISLLVVKNFIEHVQELIALEPRALCGVDLYNGILMRYVTKSSSYLGKQEDAIDFDFSYYRSKNPLIHRVYEYVIEEIEQMAFFKYGALPHWGKNRNVAFSGAIKKYKKAQEFLRVMEAYDPSRLFSSEWTDQVLGLEEGLIVYKEGCALEGLCVCSEDIHCDPSNHYLCKEGRVFKEAWVCRFAP